MPFVRRTRAALRRAEFGFLGVRVNTRVHTPRRCGAPARAGVFIRDFAATRPFLTSWLTVGMGSRVGVLTQERSAGRNLPTDAAMVAESRRRPSNAEARKHAVFLPVSGA